MSKRDSKHSSSAIRIQRSVEESQLDNSNKLKKLIEQYGFDTFGIVDINPNLDFKKELDEFLEKNHHGEMAWMEKRSFRRPVTSACTPALARRVESTSITSSM